jgi:hypothetical protein
MMKKNILVWLLLDDVGLKDSWIQNISWALLCSEKLAIQCRV